jgi:hypothetical protein
MPPSASTRAPSKYRSRADTSEPPVPPSSQIKPYGVTSVVVKKKIILLKREMGCAHPTVSTKIQTSCQPNK